MNRKKKQSFICQGKQKKYVLKKHCCYLLNDWPFMGFVEAVIDIP